MLIVELNYVSLIPTFGICLFIFVAYCISKGNTKEQNSRGRKVSVDVDCPLNDVYVVERAMRWFLR